MERYYVVKMNEYFKKPVDPEKYVVVDRREDMVVTFENYSNKKNADAIAKVLNECADREVKERAVSNSTQ